MPKTQWAQTGGAPRAKETTTDTKQISPNLEQVEDDKPMVDESSLLNNMLGFHHNSHGTATHPM
jgi:hypothetical protein